MRVNFNVGQQNNFLNAHRINQCVAQPFQQNANHLKNEKRRDIVSISPKGKAMNLIENLMKQKQNITDQKNKLISSTLDNGGNLDSIKSQLKTYEEQLKNIDEQISQAMAKDAEKQAEKLETKKDDKPKTEEEVMNDRLSNIVNISSDVEHAEIISTAKSKLEGEASVLEAEINSDGSRVLESKLDRVVEIKSQTAKLTAKVSDVINETSINETSNIKKSQTVISDNEDDTLTERIQQNMEDAKEIE